MSIQRWDPFSEGLTLRDAMNRLFEDSFVRPSTWMNTGVAALAVDVEDTDDAYTVRASLPGIKPENVNITVTGDTLTIQAEQSEESEKKLSNYLLRERRMGSFSRSITLPTRIDADNTNASFDNGELTLTLPKAPEVRPRQIKVDVANQQSITAGQSESHKKGRKANGQAETQEHATAH